MKTTVLIFALAAAAMAARASTITGLCNTGMTGSCGSSSTNQNGFTDPNFIASGMAGGTAETFYTAPYYADNGGCPAASCADWISTYINQSSSSDEATGLYNYTETIASTVTGMATISGMWATDDCGTLVASSGTVTSGDTIGGGIANGVSQSSNFTTPTPFTISMPVTSGGYLYPGFRGLQRRLFHRIVGHQPSKHGHSRAFPGIDGACRIRDAGCRVPVPLGRSRTLR
jgi:hypothetical protein